MHKIKAISQEIIDDLVERARRLGQGRSAGVIGFTNQEGIITGRSEIINGGSSGLPYRKLLSGLTDISHLSFLEMINQLPENAVMISLKPGKTGIIVSTAGINILDIPVVKVGVKSGREAGVGILYPHREYFRLASRSEKIQLKSLAALNMDEEREALRASSKLHLEYLDISEELPAAAKKQQVFSLKEKSGPDWRLPKIPEITSIDSSFARSLVEKSISIEQGREVAAVGSISESGTIQQAGDIVVGGMGYVPSRLLASSYQDISDISLRRAYTEVIPPNCMVVHTHPGGTGVMHISDAMAGPGTWGRPIAAIGHSEKAEIKGVNVIKPSAELFDLADQKEQLEQKLFEVNTSQEEVKLRQKRLEIAQKFTALCQEIELI